MSTNNINLVILSGEVGHLKLSYTANGVSYISFSIKQFEYIFEDNKIISKKPEYIIVYCYVKSVWQSKFLKNGVFVAIEAKIAVRKNKKDEYINNIVATKIDVLGSSKIK